MHSILITVPADRGGTAGSPPPFPPPSDDHDDEVGGNEAAVPPAEAERPRSLLDRLLEAISKPVEGNFDNP